MIFLQPFQILRTSEMKIIKSEFFTLILSDKDRKLLGKYTPFLLCVAYIMIGKYNFRA